MYGDEREEVIKKLKDTFEPEVKGISHIRSQSGMGIKELLYHVKGILDKMDKTPVVFEREFFPEDIRISEEPLRYGRKMSNSMLWKDRLSVCLATPIWSLKRIYIFQNFMRDNGILEKLEELGIQEGDTVRMYGLHFDYYKVT